MLWILVFCPFLSSASVGAPKKTRPNEPITNNTETASANKKSWMSQVWNNGANLAKKASSIIANGKNTYDMGGDLYKKISKRLQEGYVFLVTSVVLNIVIIVILIYGMAKHYSNRQIKSTQIKLPNIGMERVA